MQKMRANRGVLALLPAIGLLSMTVAIPLVFVTWWSISDPSLGFSNYLEIVSDPTILSVVLDTLTISAYVTGGCLVVGYPLALWIDGLPGRWRIITLTILMLPFWVSVVVRSYGWVFVLGPDSMLTWVLGIFGIPLHSLLYTRPAVVIGIANVLLPSFVLPVIVSLRKIDPTVKVAARLLGANEFDLLRRIVIPATLPGVMAGSVLVFVQSIGFYVTPAILGGGQVVMIAQLVDIELNELLRWGRAAAMAVLIVSMLIVAVGVSKIAPVMTSRLRRTALAAKPPS